MTPNPRRAKKRKQDEWKNSFFKAINQMQFIEARYELERVFGRAEVCNECQNIMWLVMPKAKPKGRKK